MLVAVSHISSSNSRAKRGMSKDRGGYSEEKTQSQAGKTCGTQLAAFILFFLPLVIEQMTLGPQHQRFLRWFAHSLLDLGWYSLELFCYCILWNIEREQPQEQHSSSMQQQ